MTTKAEYVGTDEFRFTLPIEKAFEKEVDGVSHMYIAGLASGITVDLDEERMATSAINAFKHAIDEGIVLQPNNVWSLIPLRSGHRKEWDDVLGWITKAEIDDQHQLWIEAELDNTSDARDLYQKLTEPQRHGRPTQLGFSVGGKIKKASREWDATRQKSIRVLDEVALGEISVTGRPAFAPSYVEALTKSVNWEQVPIPQEELAHEKALQEKDTQHEKELMIMDDATQKEALEAAKIAEAAKTADAVKAVDDAAKSSVTKSADPTDLGPITDAIAQLKSDLSTLAASVATLAPASSAPKEAAAKDVKEAVVEKSSGLTADTLTAALTAAFGAFKTESIDPLVADIATMKTTVNDLATQPVDKSHAVRLSKETETALEKFHAEVAKNKDSKDGSISIIGAAVRHAMGQ